MSRRCLSPASRNAAKGALHRDCMPGSLPVHGIFWPKSEKPILLYNPKMAKLLQRYLFLFYFSHKSAGIHAEAAFWGECHFGSFPESFYDSSTFQNIYKKQKSWIFSSEFNDFQLSLWLEMKFCRFSSSIKRKKVHGKKQKISRWCAEF